MNLEGLSDLSLLEEARSRLHYDDDALYSLLGVKDKNSLGVWRTRRGVPEKHRAMLLKIVRDRLRPEERRAATIEQKLDEILQRVGGTQEVRGSLQRNVGPLPAREGEGEGETRPDSGGIGTRRRKSGNDEPRHPGVYLPPQGDNLTPYGSGGEARCGS